MKNLLSLLFVFIFCASGFAQPFFTRNDSVQVRIANVDIKNPWAGGLNFVQVSNIDLNQDGVKDLFVFDRTGNKIRTFVHSATPNTTDFTYAPQYENSFPKLHDWALLVDYNCDTKEDILCYSDSGGGFDVYKNISTLSGGLQFQLVARQVKSLYNPGLGPPFNVPYNLYVSSVDIPAFADVDNDGDLDVITFASLGTYLEYHQNQSVELGYGCDSLIYQAKNHCFGYAAESPLSNVFTLHDTCTSNVPNPGITENTGGDNSRSGERHSGNCELCLDINADGAKEVVVGGISFNNLTMLTNGGIPTANYFNAVDTQFPSNNSSTVPVNLSVFPCGFYVDVNNDGIKDLIVSPNAPNVSENFNSLIYYKNIGTNTAPVFQFQQTNFLQDNMIDVGEGAYPVFFDYDNDGLQDLFVGNYGYFSTSGYQHSIAQFHNIGTTATPKFELVTRDFNNLSALSGVSNMIPAFGDMDGDTDADMFVGAANGKVHYFQNIAAIGSPSNFVLLAPNYTNSFGNAINVGSYAAPQIVDMDNDGKNDLIIGARNGKITYYNHSGSPTDVNPRLDSITNFFGKVKVSLPLYVTGYSRPQFFKDNGTTKLIVGKESGYLSLYDSIDGNLNGTFKIVDSTFLGIYQGTQTSPTIADINNDGFKDMIVGNYQGGVSFYKGVASNVSVNELTTNFDFDFNLFPNPVNNSISIKVNSDTDKGKDFEIEIINLIGETLLKQKTSAKLTNLNTTLFSEGIYFCKVTAITTTAEQSKRVSLNKRFVIIH